MYKAGIAGQSASAHRSSRKGRPTAPLGCWPRLMRAETAAAYCDERSVGSFLRAVGPLYPQPIRVKGKGLRWLREDLDHAIEQMTGRAANVRDAAAVL